MSNRSKNWLACLWIVACCAVFGLALKRSSDQSKAEWSAWHCHDTRLRGRGDPCWVCDDGRERCMGGFPPAPPDALTAAP